jgi:tetratricopeptide (TPR) repeat protein
MAKPSSSRPVVGARLAAILLVLFTLQPGSAARAQEESQPTRAAGEVLGPEGEPVVGARITLRPAGDLQASPYTTLSDKRGHWAILDLAPGRWALTVEVDGFLPSRGTVDVFANRPSPPADVRLRSLEEATPAFSEGGESTIERWLEMGDALLEQGRPAEARAEYQKAVDALPAAGKARFLQKVARTYFLEGNVDLAIATLKRALVLTPSDAELRRLFTILMEEVGKAEAAAAFLAALPEATDAAPGAGPAAGSAVPPEVAERLSAPLEMAAADLRGRHRVTFPERSPLSGIESFVERSGMYQEEARRVPDAAGYEIGEESFQLYVPPGDPPETGYGLLVWISPTGFGGFTRSGMEEVYERRGLIAIGADNAGNPRPVWDRWGMALDAVAGLSEVFPVNPDRVYVAGYSGGGRVASGLATCFPEVFGGGFSWFGVDHFHDLPVPDRPGKLWPRDFQKPAPAVLERAREQSRFVLLTGEKDFNRSQTLAVHEHLRRDGFRHLTLYDIPGATHYFGVPPEWMERGIEALDAPLGD